MYEAVYNSDATGPISLPALPVTTAGAYLHGLLTSLPNSPRPWWSFTLAAVLHADNIDYDAANQMVLTSNGGAVALSDLLMYMKDCELENDGMEFFWPVE
jgi:hypothetical protein